jgi:hypothetical protein
VSASRRRALVALTAMTLASAWGPGRAKAGETSGSVCVDRVAATIYAPEMGGVAHPHFVFERLLAFEARVVALLDRGDAGTASIEERDVREAFDHFVAGEVLSVLATKLQGDSWGEERADAAQLEETVRYVTEAATERAGGRARLDDAARIEHVESSEVDALLRREGLSAFYLDRAVTPILHPADEQLREAYRTSAHPFRGRPFEEVRDALSRWLLVGRLRAAETAFLQAARSRIRVVISR